MKPTIECPSCGNLNEVLVSSGHSKPENKGKKYFTCAKCKEFYWVTEDGPVSPRGANPPSRSTPVTTPPTPSSDEFGGWPGGEPSKPEYKERDYDAENRGKIRHGIVCARVERDGLVPLDKIEADIINELTEFVMTGKLPE